MDKVDCIVVGGGVIGLAVGRELTMRGREVLVLEAESDIGTHTSSRNSEVIHAGIYYRPGSLKATTCVRGKVLLYDYCRAKEIQHRRVGKLIVANSPSEIEILRSYERTAQQNGVDDLTWKTADEVASLEPAVRCAAALFSPSTGLIDSHEFMVSLQADLEARGGNVVCRSRVTHVAKSGNQFEVSIAGDEPYTIAATSLVNAAGLWAQSVARAVPQIDGTSIPEPHFARGHYFMLRGKTPFRHLIYPVAERGGLGIHLTLDLAGQARFGPDVQWIDGIDYSFGPNRKSRFVDAIRTYYPDLYAERLVEGYTGIRPKLSGANDPVADFVVQGAEQHGVAGLINLYGIESPGLTASLAIAERVADLLASP